MRKTNVDLQRFMKQMLANRAEGVQPAQPDSCYLLISERRNSMEGSGKDVGLGKVTAVESVEDSVEVQLPTLQLRGL